MKITLASGCSLQNCSYFSEAKIQERKEWEEAELMLPHFHFSLFQVSFPLEGLLSALGNSAEKLSLSSFRLCPLLLDISEGNIAQHIQSKLVLSGFECGWAPLQPVFLKADMRVITLETFFAVQHKLSSIVCVLCPPLPVSCLVFCLFLNFSC